MLNHISKLSLFFVFAIAMILTSCDKEGIDELTENFTTDTEVTTEAARAGNGTGSCYDLVYPLSIAFPDGTTAEAADQGTLKEMKEAWKAANPDAEERPSLVFPLQIDIDGEITDIADADALQEVKQACSGDRGNGRDGNNNGRDGRDNNDRSGSRNCYSTVFPVTIAFADGSTAEAADKEAAKAAIAAWKEANPDAEERPSIAFPYDVQLQDSSIVTIDSEMALATLKETCGSDRGGDRGDRGERCFSAVYPITIVLPDGTAVSVEDRSAKRTAIQEWKEANPDADTEAGVTIGFPLTVELADDTQTTLNSQEELDALKEACSADTASN